jgi:hypothetical protein
MPLKPQDLFVALKLVAAGGGPPPAYNRLAHDLFMSPSQVHSAVARATEAGLVGPDRLPRRQALLEFILHGVRYAFYPERGAVTRGVPTAYAAPPLDKEIASDEVLPVWPDPDGTVRGETLEPLHHAAPQAARADPKLYQLLALVDAVRMGRARERKLAEKHLSRLLKP